MHLKIIFILVLSVQFALLKKSDSGNDSLGFNLHDNDFGFGITPAQRLHQSEDMVEIFTQSHAYCHESPNYQNSSSPSLVDYNQWLMRGQMTETKLTARNSWGCSMTAEPSAKDYTFDNALY